MLHLLATFSCRSRAWRREGRLVGWGEVQKPPASPRASRKIQPCPQGAARCCIVAKLLFFPKFLSRTENLSSVTCPGPPPAPRAETLLMLQPREHLPSLQPWTSQKCSMMEKETFLKYHLMSRSGSRARENMFIYYYADFNAKDWFSD